MTGILTAGERTSAWGTIGDLARRVARLEAVRPSSGSAPTMVWGGLYNDANIIEGTGFTATWDNNGGAPAGENYITVYFDTPFTNPPVVLLTPNNNNAPDETGRYVASLVTRDVAYIVVITNDLDDPDSLTDQNGGFDFLCLEPAV